VTVLGQFIVGETGKRQFLWVNRRNLAEEKFVRKISSSGSVANMPYLCNDRGQKAGNMGEGEYCSGFGKRVSQFITGKISVTGDPLEPWATREEKESERSQISQKDFGWRNAGAVKRKTRGDWESAEKPADWHWHVLRWDRHHSRPCTSARDSAEKLEEIRPAE